MVFFRRSKAEDSVDRYNHVWSVVLLLVLSLITWLLPLSSLKSSSSQKVGDHGIPKVLASCQMPRSFTTDFSVELCKDAVKGLLTDKPYPIDEVNLHTISPDEPINMSIPDNEMAQLVARHKNKHEARSDLGDLVIFKTPLLLFVVAICLVMPQVIRALMSSCGGLNIDQVITTASKKKNYDHKSWKQLRKELSQSLRERGASRMAALSYLLMKFLAIGGAVAGVVIVFFVLYTNLDQNLKTLRDTRAEKDTAEHLACQYSTQRSQNIYFNLRQCVFIVSWDVSTLTTLANIYKPLLIGLTIYLAGLLALNVVSFMTWLVSLTAQPCRENMTCDKTSMDDYLLLRMSQLNAGPMVTHDLALSIN